MAAAIGTLLRHGRAAGSLFSQRSHLHRSAFLSHWTPAPVAASNALQHDSARAPLHYVPQRYTSSTPVNTVIKFVPQQEAWIVERMGKFHRVLEPGLNILAPLIDSIRYVQTLKEIAIEVPKQHAITNDSVPLTLDGVLFVKIVDPLKASYGVEDPEFAITQLAQTTMRSELGKISLDQVFRERESLNAHIVIAINNASAAWGISCMRYEIRDIHLPSNVQEAMQLQVAAERKKRAAILESEGKRDSEINIAEGKKRSQILASEAVKQETINHAEGEALAIVAKARARATGLANVAEALQDSQGPEAAALAVAEQYVAAFSNLAKETNTVVIPSSSNDVASAVSQAMAIYKGFSTTAVNADAQKAKKAADTQNLADAVHISQPLPETGSVKMKLKKGERMV